MGILISPTERGPLAKLGKYSSLPEKKGVDAFWVARGKQWGVQRKEFPGDFVASMRDDRLSRELAQMATLDAAILLLEGYGTWTNSGHELTQAISKPQLWNYILSACLSRGIIAWQVADAQEGASYIRSAYEWSHKPVHRSLMTRPNPTGSWGKRGNRDWELHTLQSFDGIGPGVAGKILDHFGELPLRWTVTYDELLKVEGIGKKRAQALIDALERNSDASTEM